MLGGAQDKPQTVDDFVAGFMAEHADVLAEFEDDGDEICSDHEYRAEGMPRGMSVIGGGHAGRPLESMHRARCADCPNQACADCDWGEA